MAADLLSDLTERVQETSAQYETLFDRLHDGGELDEADLQVSWPVASRCGRLKEGNGRNSQWRLRTDRSRLSWWLVPLRHKVYSTSLSLHMRRMVCSNVLAGRHD